jgi:hypothetical protein
MGAVSALVARISAISGRRITEIRATILAAGHRPHPRSGPARAVPTLSGCVEKRWSIRLSARLARAVTWSPWPSCAGTRPVAVFGLSRPACTRLERWEASRAEPSPDGPAWPNKLMTGLASKRSRSSSVCGRGAQHDRCRVDGVETAIFTPSSRQRSVSGQVRLIRTRPTSSRPEHAITDRAPIASVLAHTGNWRARIRTMICRASATADTTHRQDPSASGWEGRSISSRWTGSPCLVRRRSGGPTLEPAAWRPGRLAGRPPSRTCSRCRSTGAGGLAPASDSGR